ncbi:MAG TPA: PAS domain S-box protein [Algoriphagus sp.]|nr:PAS domain S-box protein [Algoriphagus sp.]
MSKLLSVNNPKTICLTYLIVGIAWIFFSDRATEYIFSDNTREMSRFQLYKGIFYVLVTSLMLYFLIKNLADRISGRNQELELLFSNPNLGILKLDSQGFFTHVSPNIVTITGYTAEELIGRHINYYTPAHRKDLDTQELLRIAEIGTNEGFVFNKHLLSKEGTEIIIRGYAVLLKNKKKREPEYIVAFQNITEESHFLDALESNNRQLRELASEQSHLVRAPLARIMGIANLLQAPEEIDPEEKLLLIQNLEVSAKELDLALKDISRKMNSNLN